MQVLQQVPPAVMPDCTTDVGHAMTGQRRSLLRGWSTPGMSKRRAPPLEGCWWAMVGCPQVVCTCNILLVGAPPHSGSAQQAMQCVIYRLGLCHEDASLAELSGGVGVLEPKKPKICVPKTAPINISFWKISFFSHNEIQVQGGGGGWHKALVVGSVSLWRRLLASRL